MMHRRTFLTGAAASLFLPRPSLAQALAPFIPPAMVQRMPYGSGSQSLTVDPSWYGVVNKIQPADGSQVDIYMPSTASMSGPTFIGIYPCFDHGVTVIHTAGNDTICGNPSPWYLKQDENFGFVSDWPLMTPSTLGSGDSNNWTLPGHFPHLRQFPTGHQLMAQPIIPPTNEQWVPVPGFTCAPRDPLQSPSSRIKVNCSISVSSTAVDDHVAFSLTVPGFGLVTPPVSCGPACLGVEGLSSQRETLSSNSMIYEFEWAQPDTGPNAGWLPDLFTDPTHVVQLMVKNSDPRGTLVLNPAGTVSNMGFEEFSVS